MPSAGNCRVKINSKIPPRIQAAYAIKLLQQLTYQDLVLSSGPEKCRP
jgi:hypothetical protein